MPQHIIKLNDDRDKKEYYLIWSTIVDAPVTYGMSLNELKNWYKQQYGQNGMIELEGRLERVEKFGISAYPPFNVIENYFSFNRAGEDESVLDKNGIIEKYCRVPNPTTP
jgi:hypothetical protein